jgi:chemotaxis protein methyltransferase CheR
MTAAALSREQPSEDRLSRRNFDRLARLISDYSGIKMPPTKATMLEGRLRRRLRATGIDSFDGYCSYLFDGDGLEAEMVHLIDAVTTNKTDFFREPKHFEYLAETALPALVDARGRRLRLWSAACSTGAEPYTIAMVLQAFAEQRPGVDYEILATDLSTDVLAAARHGVFNEEMLAPTPPEMRRRWVMPSVNRARRQVRMHPDLRARIAFARLNLMDANYPVGAAMDVIFCRNVMIYFEKRTQAQVLSRLCSCLSPGGYLFIGHSETIAGVDLPVTQVANTVFRRR